MQHGPNRGDGLNAFDRNTNNQNNHHTALALAARLHLALAAIHTHAVGVRDCNIAHAKRTCDKAGIIFFLALSEPAAMTISVRILSGFIPPRTIAST